jgi:hypothetical protein
MRTHDVEIFEVELKYCERCGGLWFREKGKSGVYCGGCEPKMAEVALGEGPRPTRVGVLTPVNDEEMPELLGAMLALCGKGEEA